MKSKLGIKSLGLVVIAAALVIGVFAGIGVRVSSDPFVIHRVLSNLNRAFSDVAFAQANSYPVIVPTPGASVNGKPSVFPSTTVLDSETSQTTASLSNKFTQAFDVTAINERARMVGISFTCTLVPSSGPSLTPVVEQSDDGGITFYAVDSQAGTTFAAMTSTAGLANLDFPIYGDIVLLKYTSVAGTGANWSFTATATQAK